MAQPNYEALFASLRKASQEQKEALDQAAALVSLTESFLQDQGLVASASVVMHEENDDGMSFHLSHRRHGGKFRIVIVLESVNGVETVTPWAEVPIEQRIESMEVLPTLLEQVAEKTAKSLSSLTKATATVKAMLDAVPEREGSDKRASERPAFKYRIGQGVSTIYQAQKSGVGFGFFDNCCAGPIIERELREGVPFYRVKVDRVHWHPEDQVFGGGTAEHEAKRLNDLRFEAKTR
jgi:hypothetical protein